MEKTSRKEMLELHREAVDSLSTLKLVNLSLGIDLNLLPEDYDLKLVVFDEHSDNFRHRFFCFYSFKSLQDNKDIFVSFWEKVQLDDFSEFTQ